MGEHLICKLIWGGVGGGYSFYDLLKSMFFSGHRCAKIAELESALTQMHTECF